MKKYGYPLIVIVIGSLLLYLCNNYMFMDFKNIFMNILLTLILFVFGKTLALNSKGRANTVKKFVSIFLTICLFVVENNIINIQLIAAFLEEINASRIIFYMLYIYFGFIYR